MATMVSGLMEAIISWVLELVLSGVSGILNWLLVSVFDGSFTPSLSEFVNIFLGSQITLNGVLKVFGYIGMTIGILLFFFHIMFLGGGIIENKDTFFQLFARLGAVMLLCFNGSVLFSWGFDCFMVVYEKSTEVLTTIYDLSGVASAYERLQGILVTIFNPSTASSGTGAGDFFSAVSDFFNGMGIFVTKFITGQLAAENMLAIWADILQIVFLFIIVYNFIKLVVELFKRWLTACALYIAFPAVTGCLASASTDKIFWSYVRAFASQLVLVVLTRIWLTLFCLMMSMMGESLTYMFCLIAWLSIGIKLEMFMKSIGCDIAQTGGALLDTCVMTAGGMLMATRNLGNAKKGVGGGLVNAGAKLGNASLVKTGNAMMGKSTTPAAVMNAAMSVPNANPNNFGTSSMLGEAAKAFKQGDFKSAASLINGLGAGDAKNGSLGREGAIKSLLNSTYGNAIASNPALSEAMQKGNLSNFKLDDKGNISCKADFPASGKSAMLQFGDGVANGKGKFSVLNDNGEGKVLTSTPLESQAISGRLNVSAASNTAGITSGNGVALSEANLLTGRDLGSVMGADYGDRDFSIRQGDNGEMTYYDDNDNIYARESASGEVFYKGSGELRMNDFNTDTTFGASPTGSVADSISDTLGITVENMEKVDGILQVDARSGDGQSRKYAVVNAAENSFDKGKTVHLGRDKGSYTFIELKDAAEKKGQKD